MKAKAVKAGEFFDKWATLVKEGDPVVVMSWGKPVVVMIPTSAIDQLPEECQNLLKKLISDAVLATI